MLLLCPWSTSLCLDVTPPSRWARMSPVRPGPMRMFKWLIHFKGSVTVIIKKCLLTKDAFDMWNNCQHSYPVMSCKDFLDRKLYKWFRALWMSQIANTGQWMGISRPKFLQIAHKIGIHTFIVNYLYKEFLIKIKNPCCPCNHSAI